MFALVALMCLYLGIKNIVDAFTVTESFGLISWGLLITGILLLVFFYFSTREAIKEVKARKIKKDENELPPKED